MNTPPDHTVIGHPVAHSWSPFIHGLFAARPNRPWCTGGSMFRRQSSEGTAAFLSARGRGLNVTLPHKVAAAELANELTPRASARAPSIRS